MNAQKRQLIPQDRKPVIEAEIIRLAIWCTTLGKRLRIELKRNTLLNLSAFVCWPLFASSD